MNGEPTVMRGIPIGRPFDGVSIPDEVLPVAKVPAGIPDSSGFVTPVDPCTVGRRWGRPTLRRAAAPWNRASDLEHGSTRARLVTSPQSRCLSTSPADQSMNGETRPLARHCRPARPPAFGLGGWGEDRKPKQLRSSGPASEAGGRQPARYSMIDRPRPMATGVSLGSSARWLAPPHREDNRWFGFCRRNAGWSDQRIGHRVSAGDR